MTEVRSQPYGPLEEGPSGQREHKSTCPLMQMYLLCPRNSKKTTCSSSVAGVIGDEVEDKEEEGGSYFI